MGDVAVAYELCFEFGGRLMSYNGGFRQEYAKVAPGYVLTAAVIEAGGRGNAKGPVVGGAREAAVGGLRALRTRPAPVGAARSGAVV